QTVFWGECLKIQKRQLTRNELVALNFIILGISLSYIIILFAQPMFEVMIRSNLYFRAGHTSVW
ncbi:hypothetical protein, partial [Bacteroides xylanisolvens]|uniref:hypothetical protein n=1 Tax=Bacteroides xylanisolvens TaxID=371601 RepID=UPI001E383BC2